MCWFSQNPIIGFGYYKLSYAWRKIKTERKSSFEVCSGFLLINFTLFFSPCWNPNSGNPRCFRKVLDFNNSENTNDYNDRERPGENLIVKISLEKKVEFLEKIQHSFHFGTSYWLLERTIVNAPSRSRTYNFFLKRELLYQLSYGGITVTLSRSSRNSHWKFSLKSFSL